jgi:hypothetical protein
MPPNLLAHYLYLWEITAVRQAVETAWISASVRRTFIELLVPAGSSSSLGQARIERTFRPSTICAQICAQQAFHPLSKEIANL